jgi:lambda family phage tail tape measure protein
MADDLDGEGLAAEVEPLEVALRDLEGLADSFGRAMTTAFKRAVVDGKRLEDWLKSLALSLSGRALNAALAPIAGGLTSLVGSLFSGMTGGLGFAKGGVVGPAVTPFAAGGVVATPGYFPMRDGLGLVGEAGPEAILPLARGPDGRLGVRAGGGGATQITFNVTARDAESFRRAEAEITAMLARAVARGRRGL